MYNNVITFISTSNNKCEQRRESDITEITDFAEFENCPNYKIQLNFNTKVPTKLLVNIYSTFPHS